MIHMIQAATLVLTDSGGLQEEAPSLGKPVLVLRETTERPEGIAAGTCLKVGTDPARIVAEAAACSTDRRLILPWLRQSTRTATAAAALRIKEALLHWLGLAHATCGLRREPCRDGSCKGIGHQV